MPRSSRRWYMRRGIMAVARSSTFSHGEDQNASCPTRRRARSATDHLERVGHALARQGQALDGRLAADAAELLAHHRAVLQPVPVGVDDRVVEAGVKGPGIQVAVVAHVGASRAMRVGWSIARRMLLHSPGVRYARRARSRRWRRPARVSTIAVSCGSILAAVHGALLGDRGEVLEGGAGRRGRPLPPGSSRTPRPVLLGEGEREVGRVGLGSAAAPGRRLRGGGATSARIRRRRGSSRPGRSRDPRAVAISAAAPRPRPRYLGPPRACTMRSARRVGDGKGKSAGRELPRTSARAWERSEHDDSAADCVAGRGLRSARVDVAAADSAGSRGRRRRAGRDGTSSAIRGTSWWDRAAAVAAAADGLRHSRDDQGSITASSPMGATPTMTAVTRFLSMSTAMRVAGAAAEGLEGPLRAPAGDGLHALDCVLGAPRFTVVGRAEPAGRSRARWLSTSTATTVVARRAALPCRRRGRRRCSRSSPPNARWRCRRRTARLPTPVAGRHSR